MKYSTHNLNELSFPLQFTIKFMVEYRPGGKLEDSASMFYSSDPEDTVDEIVKSKGWDKRPGYTPADVWVDGGF